MTQTPDEGGPHPSAITPVPDPTVLTTEALIRGIAAERDYVEGQLDVLRERLLGIDRATELRLTGIIEIPHQIDQKVGHLEGVMTERIAHLAGVVDEQFHSIATQFKERDIRAEREARDNKVAVDAAFAAQKEAAAKQDEANAKAIDKSEKATAETIKTNQELTRAGLDALTKTLDETKLAVAQLQASKQGGQEQRNESKSGLLLGIAAVSALFGFAGIITAVIAALTSGGTP